MTKEPWVERHRPEDFGDIQGNNKALDKIERWAEEWELGDSPQLLVGEPGTGKTTTAYVVAEQLDIPLNKVNLSLTRRSDEIKQVAGSTKSSPPDSDLQLILLDEVDNLYHNVNAKPLYEALRNPRNPIILTANDEYDVPNAVKKACDTHEFKLGVRSRKAKIKEIAEREGMDLNKSEIKRLADRPDLRSAINDLQTAAESDTPIGEDERTWAEGEFPAMKALLSGNDRVWRHSISYQDETFDRPDDAVLWADENLSQEFRGLELGLVYQMLAEADRWAGKVWERQDFKFQKYAWAFLEMIPESRLSEPYDGYINVNFPQWFRVSEAKHDGGTSEAKLFQQLKGGERGYRFSGSFYEFRQVYLPMLQDMNDDEKMELALDAGLSGDAIEALGIDPAQFDDWKEVEEPTEGDGWSPDSSSAGDADW